MSKTKIVAPSPTRNGVLAILLIVSTLGALAQDMPASPAAIRTGFVAGASSISLESSLCGLSARTCFRPAQ